MLVTAITEHDKRRNRIFIDGTFAFLLYKGEIKTYGVKVDAELTPEQYECIVEEVLLKRAKLRAMNLLTAKSYTKEKLRQKLEQGLYPLDVIEGALSYVEQFGYIDDDAYAADFIAYNAQGMNRKQMIKKLRSRGVAPDVIERQLEYYLESGEHIDEIAQIRAFLRKKGYVPGETSEEQIYKLKGALFRKGFDSDNISDAFRSFT